MPGGVGLDQGSRGEMALIVMRNTRCVVVGSGGLFEGASEEDRSQSSMRGGMIAAQGCAPAPCLAA